jgi:hypothetical protein
MTDTLCKCLLRIVVKANPSLMTGRIGGKYCDWDCQNEYRILAIAADGTETDLVFYKLSHTYQLWRDGVQVTGGN